jgi:hypothetical protein
MMVDHHFPLLKLPFLFRGTSSIFRRASKRAAAWGSVQLKHPFLVVDHFPMTMFDG